MLLGTPGDANARAPVPAIRILRWPESQARVPRDSRDYGSLESGTRSHSRRAGSRCVDDQRTDQRRADGQSVQSPVAQQRVLFEVLLAGEHALHGFTNRDVRQKLGLTAYPLAPNEDRRPGQVTRLFRRLHAHGLIAKIPRSRRWRVSLAGRRTMSTAIKLGRSPIRHYSPLPPELTTTPSRKTKKLRRKI